MLQLRSLHSHLLRFRIPHGHHQLSRHLVSPQAQSSFEWHTRLLSQCSISTGPATTKAKLRFGIPPPDGTHAYAKISVPPDPRTVSERNYSYEDKYAIIENLRGRTNATALDVTGFQLVHHPTKYKGFTNDEEIRREYYPECIEFLKEHTGASHAIVFHHSKL
jgi:hypothetical protein